ncbi:glutathione S-transferase family protein [Burkholderia anthina]|uniref:glutathione S-transferase family protein n=1 Tax=Burkholderia anthina TaxID=179879 RepID=UPI00158BA5E7|nr:glutathione S-transferase N-terminal domain-containing protein [Burkholderia anthina]
MFKLIGSTSSPFVRKVRIVFDEKMIEYDFELEDVWSPSTNIFSSNPLGKIPCLIVEGGGVLFDSRVICEYLDMFSPVCKLIPSSCQGRVDVRFWEALCDGVLDASVAIRNEYSQREEAHRSATWICRQQRKIDGALDVMSRGLGKKSWCVGNQYSLADIGVGCVLSYLDFRMPELDWRSQFQNLENHFYRLSLRKSFMDTLLK